MKIIYEFMEQDSPVILYIKDMILDEIDYLNCDHIVCQSENLL